MAKKRSSSKKKRAAPQGVESHQRKQERLEARRRAKEQALIAQQKRERRAKAIRTSTFLALGAVLVWLVFLRQTSPDAIAGNSISTYSTSNGGNQSHTAPYNYSEETTGASPPVSGSHSPSPADCGLYTEKIPDENFVHSLEHGAAAVLYDPKELDLQDIRALEEIASSYEDDAISAPYPGLGDPVVMASWSRKMALDEFDGAAVREYFDEFRDTEPAPEANGQDCENDSDDPYEPPEPDESPSPEPDDGGHGDDGGDHQGADDKAGDDKGDSGADDKGGDDKGSDDSKMEKEEGQD